MIVVTGAAGFISSCLVSHLNELGHRDIAVVDDFSKTEKAENLAGKSMVAKVQRDQFFQWANDFKKEIDFVFHLGARTDTTEFDKSIFDELNVAYSKDMWNFCAENEIPLVYASSAATYGFGEHGYKDDHKVITQLKPLNPYGDSKNDFDIWALQQDQQPPFWAGLKFFNVYGPRQDPRSPYSGVISIFADRLINGSKIKINGGFQTRDFIYVKDVADAIINSINITNTNILCEQVNVLTGKTISVDNLANMLIKEIGVKADKEYHNLSKGDPQKSEGTIRKMYAISLEKNSVHGSDSAENAKIEIAQFFSEEDIYS